MGAGNRRKRRKKKRGGKKNVVLGVTSSTRFRVLARKERKKGRGGPDDIRLLARGKKRERGGGGGGRVIVSGSNTAPISYIYTGTTGDGKKRGAAMSEPGPEEETKGCEGRSRKLTLGIIQGRLGRHGRNQTKEKKMLLRGKKRGEGGKITRPDTLSTPNSMMTTLNF